MIKNLKINIFDLNLIYILCGFPFMTTLYSNPSASICYRAIGILLPLICLIKTRFKLTIPNDLRFKTYLILLILYSFSVGYTLFWGEYQSYHGSAKNLTLLFLIGIMWIPMLGYFSGIYKIHYSMIVCIIFFILLYTIGRGYLSISDQIASTSGRFNLNDSQSTLTFGDKGIMLSIAAAALLLPSKRHIKNVLWKLSLSFGLILGIMAAMKAGSRGPIISGLIAFLFLSSCTTKNIKRLLTLFFISLFLAGAATLKAIRDFAPALYDRILMSILTGDSSGRDSIFADALSSGNFFTGGSPLIIIDEGFFGYHNIFITMAMGIGIIPTIIFICLCLSLLYIIIKNKKYYHTPGEYFIAALFIFYLFRGLTGVNFLSTNEFNLTLFMGCYLCSSSLSSSNCRAISFD